MTQSLIDRLTAAFQPSELLDTFILLAPYILGVAGIILAVGLIKWGIKKVRISMATQDFLSGRIEPPDDKYRGGY